MKNFVQNLILVLLLTIFLLFSYAFVQKKVEHFGLTEFWHFLTHEENGQAAGEKGAGDGNLGNAGQNDENQGGGQSGGQQTKQGLTQDKAATCSYRAVWLSYLEFNAYRRSVPENTEQNFRTFFQRVLNRSAKCGLNRIIVHARPFGDALYRSGYFPWAACISGTQGEDPGYDPLAVMVEMAHEKGFQIEAWINPYRVSSGSDLEELASDNAARVWALSPDKTRNVLSYDGALYYNPCSAEVQELIINGVREIVENYDVDGIHMDDYFYPVFTEENVDSAFDSLEYQEKLADGTIAANVSLADWRRQNVSALVSALHKTVKEAGKQKNRDVTFGISPAGNLSNLRSDLQYYVDIDTWVGEEGYVDYVMPQIYWGYTNDQAPFDQTLKQWMTLTKDSPVQLYVGLQLYRMGSEDDGQSDHEELQDASLIRKEITQLQTDGVGGYCLFSYQYLDVDNKNYAFDSNEFSRKRKKILKKIARELIDK